MEESLSEVHHSVDLSKKKGFFRRLFAFMGPAYLVSVGYMDPGNWATDLAGGSRYGYSLLWVLLMSNLIALLLQSHCARLGIVRGRDLAQASRETYPPFINLTLYFLAEIAIAATDLAEVIGFAIGLQLLFDIPLLYGVIISLADTFIVLILMKYGIRKIEAFILSLVFIIGICFLIQLLYAQPQMAQVSKGLIPGLPDDTALYIAIGIIGATVMPHNLYLHSALVQTRNFGKDDLSKKRAIRFNFIDSAIALNMAFFVNAAILILAASVFYKNGLFEVAEIQDAHRLLEPLLGSGLAPVLFAVALIAAGQSSTITGTLAGQIVMEGYLDLRIQPWVRRLLTRILATAPAVFVILYYGEEKTGEMLILSQVILSLQLGFAVIPLIYFVSDKAKMGIHAISLPSKIASWGGSLVIVGLNLKLVTETLLESLQEKGFTPGNLLFLAIFLFILLILCYVLFSPIIKRKHKEQDQHFHGPIKDIAFLAPEKYKRIAVPVDFSDMDQPAINTALKLGGTEAAYCLIHCVETVTAHVFKGEVTDKETTYDQLQLERYKEQLKNRGYSVEIKLGYGQPKEQIPFITKQFEADILIMGAHGHSWLKDLFLGTTVESVRHQLKIPVFIVR